VNFGTQASTWRQTELDRDEPPGAVGLLHPDLAHAHREADVLVLVPGVVLPSFITTALGNIARARGMSQLARKTGLTREGLYKALSPGGNPEFGTVMKVIRALGLELRGAGAQG